MDRQSEWIVLRRLHAFLRSRDLTATAHMLEQESGIKLDRPHVRGLLRGGRWRSADKYVSAFLLGSSATSHVSTTLYLIRFERLVRALKRGEGARAWALRYFGRSVQPLLADHPSPRKATLEADCARALSAGPKWLRRKYPDDARHREHCVAGVIALLGFSEHQLYRCTKAFVHDKFVGYKIAGTLAPRRRPRCSPMKRRPSA